MKTQEEVLIQAKVYAESIGNEDGTSAYDYVMGYKKCQEDMADKPFNNFYLRLKAFVSNVQVNDPMSEEEKEMIIYVCNKQLNKQD